MVRMVIDKSSPLPLCHCGSLGGSAISTEHQSENGTHMSQILNLSRHASDEEAQLLTSLLIYHLVERCGGQVQFTAEEIRQMREKLSMFCNVPVKAVIEEMDVKTSIYELPLMLQQEGMDQQVCDLLGIKARAPRKNIWAEIVHRIKSPKHEVRIGVVGKYIELQDAYKSVYESLTHAGIANNCRVNIVRIDAEDLEKKGATVKVVKADGGFLTVEKA